MTIFLFFFYEKLLVIYLYIYRSINLFYLLFRTLRAGEADALSVGRRSRGPSRSSSTPSTQSDTSPSSRPAPTTQVGPTDTTSVRWTTQDTDALTNQQTTPKSLKVHRGRRRLILNRAENQLTQLTAAKPFLMAVKQIPAARIYQRI